MAIKIFSKIDVHMARNILFTNSEKQKDFLKQIQRAK